MPRTRPLFPFFIGCDRSGTTLVRTIFRAHPQMAIPGETHYFSEMLRYRGRYEGRAGVDVERFLADLLQHPRFDRLVLAEVTLRETLTVVRPRTYADAVRSVYALYAAAKGKPRYGDKTPRNVMDVPELARLFPEARFVHIIRDGRDVALSLVDRRQSWSMATAAVFWGRRVGVGRDAGRHLGPNRYMELRYEDVVADPEQAVRPVCEFIDLDFDPCMLEYHDRPEDAIEERPRKLRGYYRTPPDSRRAPLEEHDTPAASALPPTAGLRDWRRQMGANDIALFEIAAGSLLEECGYERANVGSTLGLLRVSARAELASARIGFAVDRALRRTKLRTRGPRSMVASPPRTATEPRNLTT